MHEMTTILNAHVCGYMSWFVPEKVSFKAIPRAFTLMTCTGQRTRSHNIPTRERYIHKDIKLETTTYRDGTYERANTNVHHDMGLAIKWNKLEDKQSDNSKYYSHITHEG